MPNGELYNTSCGPVFLHDNGDWDLEAWMDDQSIGEIEHVVGKTASDRCYVPYSTITCQHGERGNLADCASFLAREAFR